MSDIMGLIYTGEMDTRLRELTAVRAIAAVPILSSLSLNCILLRLLQPPKARSPISRSVYGITT